MGAPLEWGVGREAAVRTRCRSAGGEGVGPVVPVAAAAPVMAGQDRAAATLAAVGAAAGTAGGDRRPLHWLVPPEREEWPSSCTEAQRALCSELGRVAVDRTILTAVANSNIAHDRYLGQYVDLVQRANISNLLLCALDNKTAVFLRKRGAAHYIRRMVTRTGADSSTTDNHATSALKFEVLHELLSLGVSVLLTDVDVPIFQNPFLSLVGDSDVENMSDGWDDRSVYGFVHTLPMSDGHGTLRSLRYETRNSGLLYVSATHEGLRLVDILRRRLAREDVWDQSAWNQETFRLAYGALQSAAVSVRVMNYLCVLNTKVLFKHLRHEPELGDPIRHLPAMAHMNYHPEKEPRMAATVAFYGSRDLAALSPWNGGEGRNSGGCVGKVGVMTNSMPPLTPAELRAHTLASSMVQSGGAWGWGPNHSALRGPVRFLPNGTLQSPWGSGSWGSVPSQWRKDSLHVVLPARSGTANETYLLMFLSEKWAFVAVRCSDEQVTYGRLLADPIPEKRLVW